LLNFNVQPVSNQSDLRRTLDDYKVSLEASTNSVTRRNCDQWLVGDERRNGQVHGFSLRLGVKVSPFGEQFPKQMRRHEREVRHPAWEAAIASDLCGSLPLCYHNKICGGAPEPPSDSHCKLDIDSIATASKAVDLV
jgi:hypothetical protein